MNFSFMALLKSTQVGGIIILLIGVSIYFFSSKKNRKSNPNKSRFLPLKIAIPLIFAYVFYCIGMTKTSIISQVITASLALIGILISSFYSQSNKSVSRIFYNNKLPLWIILSIILGGQLGIYERNLRISKINPKLDFYNYIIDNSDNSNSNNKIKYLTDNKNKPSAFYQSASNSKKEEFYSFESDLNRNFKIILLEILSGYNKCDIIQINDSLNAMIPKIDQLIKTIKNHGDTNDNLYTKLNNIITILKDAQMLCYDFIVNNKVTQKDFFKKRISYQILGASALFYSNQKLLLPIPTIPTNLVGLTAYPTDLFEDTLNTLLFDSRIESILLKKKVSKEDIDLLRSKINE